MLGLTPGARVIVLGPHPDDGEFGCGATIARLIDEGVVVYYAMFSLCEESVPADFPRDVLKTEAQRAAVELGIAPDNLRFFDFPVRKFPQYRQEILETMVSLRADIRPNLVIAPSNQDLHQDHGTISAEAWRAFKSCSLLGYEVAWNNLAFTTHAFCRVSPDHIDRKVAAVKHYKSQLFRSYAKESFIRSLAEVRGTQISSQLAEAFEVMRWIV